MANVRLGDKGRDEMVKSQLAALGKNTDAHLVTIKAYLDANFSQYRVDGKYTVPHIQSAISMLLAQGKL